MNVRRNGAKRSSGSRAAHVHMHAHTLGDLPRKLHLVLNSHPSGLMATYTFHFAADAGSDVTAIGGYHNKSHCHTHKMFLNGKRLGKKKTLEKPKFASPDVPGC